MTRQSLRGESYSRTSSTNTEDEEARGKKFHHTPSCQIHTSLIIAVHKKDFAQRRLIIKTYVGRYYIVADITHLHIYVLYVCSFQADTLQWSRSRSTNTTSDVCIIIVIYCAECVPQFVEMHLASLHR